MSSMAMGEARTHAGVSSGRLAAYLAFFQRAQLSGKDVVTSASVARVAGVNSTVVRRDLSEILGKTGTRGSGYDVERSVRMIRETLGADGETLPNTSGGALLLIAAEAQACREGRETFGQGSVSETVREAARCVLALDAMIAQGGG